MGTAKTTKHKLTPKEEKFCRLYATDTEFFGNGTQSFIKAYWSHRKQFSYLAARACAYELLTKPHILTRINELLDAGGLNDAHVDKQLYQVLTQSADYKAKIAAIKEYNLLKKRTKLGLEVGFTEEAKEALAKLATILP